MLKSTFPRLVDVSLVHVPTKHQGRHRQQGEIVGIDDMMQTETMLDVILCTVPMQLLPSSPTIPSPRPSLQQLLSLMIYLSQGLCYLILTQNTSETMTMAMVKVTMTMSQSSAAVPMRYECRHG